VKVRIEVPALPSAIETSLIETWIGVPSSLTIVPIPCASAIVAPPVALVRFSSTVSSSSGVPSLAIATVTVAWTWLSVKESVPLVAV